MDSEKKSGIRASILIAFMFHGLLFAVPFKFKEPEKTVPSPVGFLLVETADIEKSEILESSVVPDKVPAPVSRLEPEPMPPPDMPTEAEWAPVLNREMIAGTFQPGLGLPRLPQSLALHETVPERAVSLRPPPPIPDRMEPVRTSVGSPGGPRFNKRVEPEYPMRARRMGWEGAVTLELHINAEGELLEIILVGKAGHGLDESAVSAIEQSTFFPAVRDGKPVDSLATLTVRFQLR
ncbi:MAG TPA: energy transducer TonB [Acidobacteriota bacterium]|nr:energy transducer TonB [Acidobacteriota bacterium]